MKNKFCSILIALILVGLYSCSNPGKNTTDNASINSEIKKEPIDTADTRLVNDLSLFCTTQIKAGQLAATNASTPKVKAFGKQTADLYTTLNNTLNRIAEKYNIKLPAAATPVSTKNLQKITAVKGASFDHNYLLQTLKQHNAMIREYNAAKNIQCIPLKMFLGSNQADIIKKAYAASALKDETS